MTDEQTIRQRATELAIDLNRAGMVAASVSSNEDDIIRAADKIAAFINAGTVPTP